MELLYSIDDNKLNDIQKQFEASIITTKYALGKHAFRKYFQKGQRKYPLNKSLFEVWTVIIAFLTEEERSFIRKNRVKLKEEVSKLMNSDEEFIKSITSLAKLQKLRALKWWLPMMFTTLSQMIK